MQLSMLDLMAPPPIPYSPPVRREVITRVYGGEYPMEIGEDELDPVEIEVRGIPTLIRFGGGWQTYTVQPAGSLYWSETGFRSFYGSFFDRAGIVSMIEAHIDHKNGCNGKLTKWWPSYALQWRQEKRFGASVDRATTWAQWGREEHRENWARFDAGQAAAIERMRSEGIDPEDVWRTR